jgi:hypothetical protein
MAPLEISLLPKAKRDEMFRDAIVYSIGLSIVHRDITTARLVYKTLPYINKKPAAKDALVKFFESWGNIHHNNAHDELRFNKRYAPEAWTAEHEAHLKKLNWADEIDESQSKKMVYDADEEFRAVLRRLKKAADDPDKTVLHAVLLTKIEEVIYAYGRTDQKLEEEKRGRTLFDKSIQMNTLRAGKFAKGS